MNSIRCSQLPLELVYATLEWFSMQTTVNAGITFLVCKEMYRRCKQLKVLESQVVLLRAGTPDVKDHVDLFSTYPAMASRVRAIDLDNTPWSHEDVAMIARVNQEYKNLFHKLVSMCHNCTRFRILDFGFQSDDGPPLNMTHLWTTKWMQLPTEIDVTMAQMSNQRADYFHHHSPVWRSLKTLVVREMEVCDDSSSSWKLHRDAELLLGRVAPSSISNLRLAFPEGRRRHVFRLINEIYSWASRHRTASHSPLAVCVDLHPDFVRIEERSEVFASVDARTMALRTKWQGSSHFGRLTVNNFLYMPTDFPRSRLKIKFTPRELMYRAASGLPSIACRSSMKPADFERITNGEVMCDEEYCKFWLPDREQTRPLDPPYRQTIAAT